jgi:hypothetical protein
MCSVRGQNLREILYWLKTCPLRQGLYENGFIREHVFRMPSRPVNTKCTALARVGAVECEANEQMITCQAAVDVSLLVIRFNRDFQ